jgi:hypothetical protein
VGGEESSAAISANLTFHIQLARSFPVGVEEQEGEGEEWKDIMGKTTMVMVRKQEALLWEVLRIRGISGPRVLLLYDDQKWSRTYYGEDPCPLSKRGRSTEPEPRLIPSWC